MRKALLVVIVSVAAGCADPSAPRGSGAYTLVVASPNGAEGAAIVDIAGAHVTGVTSDSAVVHTATAGDRLRLVLLRAEPGVLQAVVAVADTARPLDARLIQVAGPDDALRTSLAGYRVEVRR